MPTLTQLSSLHKGFLVYNIRQSLQTIKVTLKQSKLEGGSGSTMVLEKKSDQQDLIDPGKMCVVHCVLLKHCITVVGDWSMEE